MQQVLALLALTTASILSLNTMRLDDRNRQRMVQTEVESLGADVVQSTFERIAALPFDAVADPTAAADLTPASQFGGTGWAGARDVDDFHNASSVVTVEAPHGALSFTLSATVEYVTKSGSTWVLSNAQVAGGRTLTKRLTLRQRNAVGSPEVVVTRVFSASGV